MVGVTIVVRAELSVRTFGRGGRAFVPDFRSASRPRHPVVSTPPHRYFVVKLRRGGPGSAGLSTQTAVRHRFCTEISVDHRGISSRNFGAARPKLRLHGAALRRGGRRVSAHAAGMGPRPIGVRLSVCVRVSYPKAAPVGIEMVKRRTHERLQVQT